MRFLGVVLLIVVHIILISAPLYAANIWEKRKQTIESVKDKAEPAQEEKIASPEEPIGVEAEEFIEEDMEAAFEEPEIVAKEGPLNPKDINIPDEYGTIIETHEGTNGKLIVHIQDAHCNYEGQMNEARILEALIKDYDLTLILPEGQINDKNLQYLREKLPTLEREDIASDMVKEGYFTGVNYIDYATDYPIKIGTMEDGTLYDSHVASLWGIDKFKDLASEYIKQLTSVADRLKQKIYNQDLLDLDNKKKDYDSEKLDLVGYYEYLYKKAEEKDITLYTFPNFQNLIKASELEKKIDLAKVRDGSASDEEMALYDEYTAATRDLNVNELFKEEPMLEDLLQDTLATNADQKKLLKISKALSIMKNLLAIKTVPEEYKYFIDNRKDFDPAFWTEFLDAKSQELGISLNIPTNNFVISDNLAAIEKFYSIAFERDRIFVERTNKCFKKENVKLAALVAGGFHTPALTELLSDAGYSYVVISPKVTTETDDELYRWSLKKDRPPKD
jgi:hypothetical protein